MKHHIAFPRPIRFLLKVYRVLVDLEGDLGGRIQMYVDEDILAPAAVVPEIATKTCEQARHIWRTA